MPPPVSSRCAAGARKRARTQNVPAYVIFHDSTLREIALAQPDGLDSLAGISGVGSGKLERYGRAVLDTLASAG